MPKFIAKKNFKLDFLGTEWKDCFMIFSTLSITENKNILHLKLRDKKPEEIDAISTNLLKDHFIEGVGYDDETKSIVHITKDDIESLPSEVQEKAILFLVGGSTQTNS